MATDRAVYQNYLLHLTENPKFHMNIVRTLIQHSNKKRIDYLVSIGKASGAAEANGYSPQTFLPDIELTHNEILSEEAV